MFSFDVPDSRLLASADDGCLVVVAFWLIHKFLIVIRAILDNFKVTDHPAFGKLEEPDIHVSLEAYTSISVVYGHALVLSL